MKKATLTITIESPTSYGGAVAHAGETVSIICEDDHGILVVTGDGREFYVQPWEITISGPGAGVASYRSGAASVFASAARGQ